MDHKAIQTGESSILSGASDREHASRDVFYKLYVDSPIPKEQTLNNLGLFMKRQQLSRILMLNDMYKKNNQHSWYNL